MTLILLFGLLALALLPLGMAGVEPGSGSGEQGTGEDPIPDPGSPIPDSSPTDESIAAQGEADFERIVAGGGRGAAPPGAPPEAGAEAPPLEGDEPATREKWLADFGVDLANVPPELRGPVGEHVEKLAKEWLEQRYAPAAMQVREQYQAVQADQQKQADWYQRLEQFCAGDAYTIGAQLAENPQLLAAVNQYLSGQTTSPAAKRVDPASLDDETRAVYETAQAADQRAASLEAHVAELQRTIAEIHHGQTAHARRLEGWDEERSVGIARPQIEAAVGELSKELGFDVTTRSKAFDETLGIAVRMLRGMSPDERRSGIKIGDLLRQAARAAGLYDVANRRAEQARTSAAPPGYRRAEPRPPETDEEIAEAGAAEFEALYGR